MDLHAFALVMIGRDATPTRSTLQTSGERSPLSRI
jgi:hypothetical protein